MAKRNVVVSRQIRLEGAGPEGRTVAPRGLEVELDEGRRVRLDPENPRSEGFARVLAGLAELRRPVYLELDPNTEAVSRLLIPAVGRIKKVRDVEDGVELQLDTSHRRYLLRRQQDDFAEMELTLRKAQSAATPVMLTSDDAQEVADIRFFRPGPDDGPIPDFPPRPETELGWLDRIRLWPIWPWRWWWYRCVSTTRAQQIFDTMSATSCNPNAIAPPCIPYMFPDDGCWARAHEMRRLMNNMGIEPKKIWINGWLHTPTRNNPNCFVNWGWHVAPTICVRRRWRPWYIFWWWWGERMVIDPSLFATPVTKTDWKAVQGDPNATLTETAGSDYWFGQTDPAYVDTNYYLGVYRLELQNRVNQVGPPPYAQCP
jgi:hypothetical protein